MSEIVETLEQLTGRKLKVRLNQNRSTMLSKRHLKGDRLSVSLHRQFLEAPPEVLEAVAAFLNDDRDRAHKKVLNTFIHGIESRRPPGTLITKGRIYDLQEIYTAVNEEYFEGMIGLHITWFRPRRQGRKTCTLGRYCDQRRLITISTALDSPRVIRQFVEFVVYHEMVHHVHPPKLSPAGRSMVHHRAFRQKERQFRDYEAIRKWEKQYFGGT